MRSTRTLLLSSALLLSSFGFEGCAQTQPADGPYHIDGPEQSIVSPTKPGGGLPPVVGVRNIEVLRATKARPDLSDGLGYTYHHHVDMAVWKGKLWLAWDSCERDEDTWPSHELYSTSSDGAEWSKPAELFPQGVSTPLRLYFFHAPNGRMLAFAGLRVGHNKTTEDTKGPLVVREIRDDGSLGTVYMLRSPQAAGTTQPVAVDSLPLAFNSSGDPAFIQACDELLLNHVYLQTQDFGLLLDPADRMKWNDNAHWNIDRGFGKAMSFFHRKDGMLIAIGKRGWTTTTTDNGATWTDPIVPPTLVTGQGKVWGQPTPDGRYALVYNPDKRVRFPLVMVTSDDGVAFGNMRTVHDEMPPRRYDGTAKSLGVSYIRGVSEWASDGTRNDAAMFIAYSSNKEDIWVTRVPVPVVVNGPAAIADDFASAPLGSDLPGWNVYRPKWSDVSIAAAPDGSRCLQVEDRDPIDHAKAVRVFAEAKHVVATFDVAIGQAGPGSAEVQLLATFGGAAPATLKLDPDGKLRLGTTELATLALDRWLAVKVDADCAAKTFSVSVDGREVSKDVAFEGVADTIDRIAFRAKSKADNTEAPATPCTLRVKDLHVETKY